MNDERTHGRHSAIDDTPAPNVGDLSADVSHAIATAGAEPHRAMRAVMEVLAEQGWVREGLPPVVQVLADARQFSDELILHKVVVRFFRVMILGAVVIPGTPAIMNWLRDYIDGNHKVHGPLGRPMVWPDRLVAASQLLREWGFQPTPTVPPYVSPRPGGPLKMVQPSILDPQAPDPASVVPLSEGRERVMGELLDEVVGAAGAMAVDRMTALRAMSVAFDRGATHVADGWIVGNGDGTKWRTWGDGCSLWTPDREEATRYARREDAEAVHRDDDDAWWVVPYADQEQEG